MPSSSRNDEELSQSIEHPTDLSHTEVQHHGDFDSEQAAMLGGAGESIPYASMYGGLHENVEERTSLSPSALLESLASYKQSNATSNVPISNDHFASLLQAAATAGEQVGSSPSRKSVRYSRNADQIKSTTSFEPTFVTSTTKRKRDRAPIQDEGDEEERLRLERQIWGPEDDENGVYIFELNRQSQLGSSNARALGLHSAAALFRRPSKASKKYTRPPISKTYTSLELLPEVFVHLQAAAKEFMLDSAHPERRESVGIRGQSDTDMVKLKLFSCVEEFLDEKGWGERCWGATSEGTEERRLQWPAQKAKIITQVTPLLRRIITNERQRQYAVQARGTKNPPGGAKDASSALEGSIASTNNGPSQEDSSINDDIGPKLDNYHYSLDHSFSTPAEAIAALHRRNNEAPGQNTSAIDTSLFQYHVNIMADGTRIRPKLVLVAAICPRFTNLVQNILNVLKSSNHLELSRIKVHMANGLMDVDSDETLVTAIKDVEENEWMEGILKVVVEVQYHNGDAICSE